MKKIAADRNYRLAKIASELPQSFLERLKELTHEQLKNLGSILMDGGLFDAGDPPSADVHRDKELREEILPWSEVE